MLRRIIISLVFCIAWSAGAHAGQTPFHTGCLTGHFTLSNGNLKAVNNDGTGAACQGNANASGKIYFEMTVTSTSSNNNNYYGIYDGTNVFQCKNNTNGQAVNQATTVLGTCFPPVANAVVGVAVDTPNGLIWFRNTGLPNEWNCNQVHSCTNSNANPATGSGGYNISTNSTVANTFIVGAFEQNYGVTVNTGATGFAAAPPAGFSSFDVQSGIGLLIWGCCQ